MHFAHTTTTDVTKFVQILRWRMPCFVVDVVGVTCWELKSYLFKALVLPPFSYVERFGGRGEFEKIPLEGMRIHMTTHIREGSSIS